MMEGVLKINIFALYNIWTVPIGHRRLFNGFYFVQRFLWPPMCMHDRPLYFARVLSSFEQSVVALRAMTIS